MAQGLALALVGDAMAESTARADRDVSVFGRAMAAYRAVWAEWDARIEAVQGDRSLTEDQRQAAIFSLKLRQRIEAKAARRRILLDERQRQKAARLRRDPKL